MSQKTTCTLSLILCIFLSACKISGKITDSDGYGLEGVKVELHGTVTQMATTNLKGEFSFTFLPPGHYFVIPGKCNDASPRSIEIDKNSQFGNATGVDFVLGCPQIGMTYGTTETLSANIGIDILSNYRDAIEENNGIVVKLTVAEKESKIQEKLIRLQGLLIPGGVDVDPFYYNEEKHEKLEYTDTKLDTLEIKILKYARNHFVPVLAICRGIQVANVAFGGSLYQDIPALFPNPSVIIHRDKSFVYHDIDIVKNSLFFDITGFTQLNVNSSHHQGIKELGDGLVVSATSMDGMAEVIESAIKNHYLIGVQFHPEVMRKEDETFNHIFEHFLLHTQ